VIFYFKIKNGVEIMKTIFILLLIMLVLNSCSEEFYERTDNKNGVSKDTAITKVVLLGTGTPNATPERSGPSVAIIVRNTPYIVDCGPGLVRRASAAHKKGIKALKVENLKHLFITHLHSDHTLGLADIMLCPWVSGRKEALNIWGPAGTKSMVSHITQAYQQDINVRLGGLQPATKNGYKTNVTEFKQGLIYQDSNVNVYAYKVDHGDWDEAYSFQFVTPDKVITISGDCKPCDGILEASMGCDILIHEVYSYIGYLTRKPEWQRYHKASHTSTLELAELANKVKPKTLVLYHILSWGASDKNLVKEISQDYKGKIICGSDLDVIY
jgi:ribonuclease BN (tRNA processing enzyme)